MPEATTLALSLAKRRWQMLGHLTQGGRRPENVNSACGRASAELHLDFAPAACRWQSGCQGHTRKRMTTMLMRMTMMLLHQQLLPPSPPALFHRRSRQSLLPTSAHLHRLRSSWHPRACLCCRRALNCHSLLCRHTCPQSWVLVLV